MTVMTVSSQDGGRRSDAAEGSMLPVHTMSYQTCHILQAQRVGNRHNQKVLYAFALVLAFAVACTLLMVISSGTAYAVPLTATSASVSQFSVAMAALLSLAASALAALIIVRLPAAFRP